MKLPEKIIINHERQLLVLDEKGSRSVNDPKCPYYFLGGISIGELQGHELAKQVRAFKKNLYPELSPAEWELKGDRGPKGKTSLDEARRKWLEWSTFLENINISYWFHGCLIALQKFCDHLLEGKTGELEERVLSDALQTILNRLVSTKLCNVRYVPIHKPTHQEVEFSRLQVVHDHLSGLQLETITRAYESFSKPLTPHLIPREIKIIDPQDFDSIESNLVQFVDMQCYAFSRFACPSGDSKNMLVGFEEYPRDFISGKVHQYEHMPDHGKEIVERFYKLTPIFHHIRHRIQKCWFGENGKRLSTIALISKTMDEEFGGQVDHAIWEFCNGKFDYYKNENFLALNH